MEEAPAPDVEVLLVDEPRSHVRRLTLNRPRVRNALNRDLRERLRAELLRADDDPDVRAVVLTGASRTFSAGVDLSEGLKDRGILDETSPAELLRSMKTPVIAAVGGYCYTGALEMALSCTFIVCSSDATFADTHAAVGLISGWGMSALLPRAIGEGPALKMMLTGASVSASEALRLGLAVEVTHPDELDDVAADLASDITTSHPSAVAATVDLVRRSSGHPLAEALRLENEAGQSWKVDVREVARRFRG